MSPVPIPVFAVRSISASSRFVLSWLRATYPTKSGKEGNMKMVTRLIVTGAMLGAGAGALARGGAVVRRPIAAAVPQVSSENDGFAPLVTIGLEPSAILQGPSGDGLELQLSLSSRSQRPVMLRYSYELIDDRGNPQQKPVMSSLTALATTGVHAAQLATPAGLADGYYETRVTAAADDGVEDTLQVAERYFVVKHGAVTPLSSDEWFQMSNANQGRRL
jgi:hypothetical protein